MDWKLLAPHKPLDPDSDQYVAPPSSGAKAIADWILAGGTTVLVGGPTGVGKSTELAQAAKLLRPDRVACVVALDRQYNMRKIGAVELLRSITEHLVTVASETLGLPLSNSVKDLVHQSEFVLNLQSALSGPRERLARAQGEARNAIAEIERLAAPKRIALCVDGLEKVPQGDEAAELFAALSSLPETVDLAMVVPWHAAFGPSAESVVRSGEHLVVMRPVVVSDEVLIKGVRWLSAYFTSKKRPEVTEGVGFLASVLLARLPANEQWDETAAPLIARAVVESGGIPRVFLQLLADAGTYARLKRGEKWPSEADLAEAIADQHDSFRRLLLPGDVEALRAVDGKDGLELDLGRKIRFLAHGLLLERVQGRSVTLDTHPLIRPTLAARGADA